MNFGFTRDSVLWWLAIAGSVVVYLSSSEHAPNFWSYKEWLQFAAFGISTLSGKLASSPLAHSEEKPEEPKPLPPLPEHPPEE